MTQIRGCIDCGRIDITPDVNHRCMDCAGRVEQPTALPAYMKQDLRYRRADLLASIGREENHEISGLLHAARRAVKFLDRLLEEAG